MASKAYKIKTSTVMAVVFCPPRWLRLIVNRVWIVRSSFDYALRIGGIFITKTVPVVKASGNIVPFDVMRIACGKV